MTIMIIAIAGTLLLVSAGRGRRVAQQPVRTTRKR
jgi:hypothetical protein